MNKDHFYWSDQKEPHAERRKEIMKEFPEVKKLFTKDPSIAFKSLFVVALHLSVPMYFRPENPWVFMLLVLVLGTTCFHIISLAIHEITHDLAFRSATLNNIVAIIVNFPMVFPYAMAFKAYHAEHHYFQGKDGIDTDIASKFEGLVFRGFWGKLLWMILQIPFYALRPVFIRPMKPDKWQLINWAAQILFMAFFFWMCGWYGVLYLFLSGFLANGLHPIGGHFVSEHYIFKEGQETYSYYGWLNKLVFNVGYHNEHHDFPNIPGKNLPVLKKMAGRHYDHLLAYNSWSKVIFSFLTNKKVNLFSRVKREM